MNKCYDEVVTMPLLLNRYPKFGACTYGESTNILVSKLIDECNVGGKIFVDLGSGVGQVLR